MNELQNFEGDVLIVESQDGGDLVLANGLIFADEQFSTAVYVSLFGGNKEDAGKVKNKDEWWGNFLSDVSESEKLRSRFQYVISGLPMSIKNIREAELAAEMDLKWFIDEKIADIINIKGRATGKNNFNLIIEIFEGRKYRFSK